MSSSVVAGTTVLVKVHLIDVTNDGLAMVVYC